MSSVSLSLAALVLASAGAALQAPSQPEAGGPRRAGLFASPMGEPFRGPDGEARWFAGTDTDGDGRLTVAEMVADAARFFALLDVARDGEIDPDDIERYERGSTGNEWPPSSASRFGVNFVIRLSGRAKWHGADF
jgi:hypothetical protein